MLPGLKLARHEGLIFKNFKQNVPLMAQWELILSFKRTSHLKREAMEEDFPFEKGSNGRE